MVVIKKEPTAFFDVDETLILSKVTWSNENERRVNIQDPLNKDNFIVMTAHEQMIRLLKEEKHRGSYIVVWSRGGNEWAANVLRALNLDKYVDLVMSKPMAYFDDKDISEWLPYRVYIPADVRYKE
jgi:HAD superfamily phosphatase (TIGR01681 family)